ncbi:MAG: PspA/IM30 family protein [Deltaproteobacteria bacterium]|nr:PspA/IM30 family protein [Deltaproteobacteria bacterium]
MLNRIKRIVKAHGNDLIDRLEEPKKMLRQAVRDMEKQKLALGEKIVQLDTNIRGLKRKDIADEVSKAYLEQNIEKLEQALKKLGDKYDYVSDKIEQSKSKIAVLEARATVVEATEEAMELLKDLDIDIDTSTFARMEEKIAAMEDKMMAKQDFYGIGE